MKVPTDIQQGNKWLVGIILLLIPLVCCVGVVGSCLLPPDPEAHVNRSMTEVETSAKEMGLSGTVLYETDEAEVIAIDLATGTKKTVFKCRGDYKIHALEGPNKNGVAVVVENDFVQERHRLIRLNLAEGTQEILWDRPGDALWKDAIGEQLALADERNLLVVYSGHGGTQLVDPPAYMTTGKLVLLDLDTKKESLIAQPAFEGCAAISADGTTIWFAKALDREQAKKLPGGSAVTNGNGPTCGIYEWSDSKSKPVAAGFYIQNLLKPHTTLVSGNGTDSFLLDRKTMSVLQLDLPSYVGGIEEWLPDDTILASCPQSDPSKVVFIGDNFSRGVHAQQRIVAISPKKNQIHTIVQTFDSEFDHWSYGAWSKTTSSQSQP